MTIHQLIRMLEEMPSIDWPLIYVRWLGGMIAVHRGDRLVAARMAADAQRHGKAIVTVWDSRERYYHIDIQPGPNVSSARNPDCDCFEQGMQAVCCNPEEFDAQETLGHLSMGSTSLGL